MDETIDPPWTVSEVRSNSEWNQEDCDARYTVFTVKVNPHPGHEVFHSWRRRTWGYFDWDDLYSILYAINTNALMKEGFLSNRKRYYLYDKHERDFVDVSMSLEDIEYHLGYSCGSNYGNLDTDYNHSDTYRRGYEDGWGDADLEMLDEIGT